MRGFLQSTHYIVACMQHGPVRAHLACLHGGGPGSLPAAAAASNPQQESGVLGDVTLGHTCACEKTRVHAWLLSAGESQKLV